MTLVRILVLIPVVFLVSTGRGVSSGFRRVTVDRSLSSESESTEEIQRIALEVPLGLLGLLGLLPHCPTGRSRRNSPLNVVEGFEIIETYSAQGHRPERRTQRAGGHRRSPGAGADHGGRVPETTREPLSARCLARDTGPPLSEL